MQVAALTVVEDGVFRLQRAETDVSISLDEPDKFVVCAKSCDGRYHSVNSDISLLFSQYKHLIQSGNIGLVVGKLSPDESLHGQRYVVFKKNEKEAFLLGTVVSALKKLSGIE